ncbi:MAG: Fic family protein [Gemmatimonadaceae bacterium]|nr:Fic family protein [Gemmatimonadaceae bacterium]
MAGSPRKRTAPDKAGRRSTPAEDARKWWGRHARAHRYVVSSAEAPSAGVATVLRQEGLVMEVAGRRTWILVPQPPQDRRAVFLSNYWPVVENVLTRYNPSAVVGLEAVKLHLGDFTAPDILPVQQGANRSEYLLELEPGFSLRLRPRDITGVKAQELEAPGGARIRVLCAADLLATLDEPEVADGVEPVTAWLRHLVIRTPDLERATSEWPRPQVLRRLADVSAAIDNKPLARQLDAAARRISTRSAPPSRTGVGSRIIIPPAILAQPRASGSPWLDEQAMRLERQSADISKLLGSRIAALPSFRLQHLIANAVQSKAYDAYHSTTMEGYRISLDVVDAIVRGDPPQDGPQDETSLRAAMAVQGYSVAFDSVLVRAKNRSPVTGSLILDLYEDLFRPSVDAGIVEPGELRGWRTSSVSLKGWRHVPPNARKIRDLIDGLETFAAESEIDPVTRAFLVHLEFVTIHPFLDGNGRLGRLLMNLELLSGGLPWVTVRADERNAFFRAIESAQVDNDTEPFIRYLWHLLRQSIHDMENSVKQKRGGARRRK